MSIKHFEKDQLKIAMSSHRGQDRERVIIMVTVCFLVSSIAQDQAVECSDSEVQCVAVT